jgi:hypothetical protein
MLLSTSPPRRLQVRIGHGLGGLQRESPGEYREAREEPALDFRQELVAPRKGVAKRLLAGGGVARAAGEELQAAAEALQHSLGREQRDAGGGQLDREGQAVEAARTAPRSHLHSPP